VIRLPDGREGEILVQTVDISNGEEPGGLLGNGGLPQ
jgi:hypothetical protein